jgi:hypothetical protein
VPLHTQGPSPVGPNVVRSRTRPERVQTALHPSGSWPSNFSDRLWSGADNAILPDQTSIWKLSEYCRAGSHSRHRQ